MSLHWRVRPLTPTLTSSHSHIRQTQRHATTSLHLLRMSFYPFLTHIHQRLTLTSADESTALRSWIFLLLLPIKQGAPTTIVYIISQYPDLPITLRGAHAALSYSRNFYSISTYVTGHVILGSTYTLKLPILHLLPSHQERQPDGPHVASV